MNDGAPVPPHPRQNPAFQVEIAPILAPFHGERPPAPAWFDEALAHHRPERSFVEVEGAQIEMLTWGERGKPGLLFLHGNGAHADWWSFIVPFFAAEFRCAAISWSGMGRSGWRDAYSIDQFGREALACAEAAGLFEAREKPIVIAKVHAPSELIDPEFSDLTHLSIPIFSLEELDAICAGSPQLRILRESANRDTLELLRVPFNLRLAAELLDTGMQPAEFSPLRDQVGLLDAYWKRRVSAVPEGDSREQVLRLCLLDMVANRRLRTSRAKALERGATKALEQLLSRNVLSEWQAPSASNPNRQLIAFGHNVLFDFGAAELYLPHEPQDFLAMLAAQPDLALLLRPSLHMRFQRLWMADKEGFWDLTFQLCADESLPALLQSCPLAVVAENAKSAEDVRLLREQLRKDPAQQTSGAARAYRHLVGVLVAGGSDNQPDLGPDVGPWLDLASDALHPAVPSQAIDAQSWFDSALEKWGTQTVEQMTQLGTLTRIMLERVWAAEDRNSLWVKAAIRNVVKTFGSDCEASALMLRKAFELDHLMQHGHEELTLMAREVSRLARIAPEFVRDLYIAAFSWEETSEGQTYMFKSQLGSFLSNRPQDYKHARWELA